MKIGILGGSFNPVHAGHVRMGIEVMEQLGLDRVELVPASKPPHKEEADILPFDLRLELVERAVAGVPGLEANPIESKRSGPSFTCDTLHCYRTEQPSDEFTFILGASTFLELPIWRRGLDIPSMASLAVVSRWTAAEEVGGFIAKHWPEASLRGEREWVFPEGTTVRLVDIPRLDIKGGHIRRRWREHRRLHYLVPDSVIELLDERVELLERHWGKRS